jgi:hypothetical protein
MVQHGQTVAHQSQIDLRQNVQETPITSGVKTHWLPLVFPFTTSPLIDGSIPFMVKFQDGYMGMGQNPGT